MATGDARLDVLPIKMRPGYCHTCDEMTSFAVFSVDEYAVPNPIDDIAAEIERERDELIALSRTVPTWFTLQKRLKHQKRKKATLRRLEELEAKIPQAEFQHYRIEECMEYATNYWERLGKKPTCISCYLESGRTTQRDEPIFTHHCGTQIAVHLEESPARLMINGIAFGETILVDSRGGLRKGEPYRTAVGSHHWVRRDDIPLPH